MASRILDRLRRKIHDGRYLIPFHAADELDDDEISIFDVENIILTGGLVQRQRDARTRERKYVIRGRTLAGEPAACVVKVGPQGRLSSSRRGVSRARRRCGICGREGTELRHVTRSFGKGDRLIVIEGIPYLFCPRCGERYFTAATLREVERIKMRRGDQFRRKPIPVVSFGAA
jgi:YgiT-type zinc finger domain-containing protein